MESKNFLKWFFATAKAPTSSATASASASMPSPVDSPPPDPHPNALLVSDALHKLDFEDKAEKDEEKIALDDGVGEFQKEKNEAEGQGDTAAADAGTASSVGLGLGFGRKNKFPVRPEAEDCAFYIKTGTCKFGSNCKFNHPLRNRIHPQVLKEKVKDKEESKDRTPQVECKYYLTPGGCKYGESCRFNHSKGNPMAPPPAVELNFLGLPIRPGEKECPYYMRTGTCKFASVCKFNHPDPTSGGDQYNNGGSTTMQNIAQFPLWSPSGTLNNESTPYVPMMYSPGQVVSSPNGEWNGYQFPLNPQGQNMPPPPAYVISPMGSESQIYTNQPQQMAVEEFPERPGLPECSYFLKTGDCKFKSSCKYHHPKDRVQKSPQVALSDKGLPLRPDQNICSYYSRYGICKFGPSCKFDHSMQFPPSELEMQSSVEISSGDDDPTTGRSRRKDDDDRPWRDPSII